MYSKHLVLTGLIFLAAISGCGKSEPASAGDSAPSKPAAGVISGKVTFADGKPIDTPGVAFNISIYGVSTAGEKVSYSPAIKPDGTFSQKAVAGSYRFSSLNNIEVPLGNETLRLPLEPVGNAWNKDRDVADGIVQDFVWKPTGLTPYGRENGASPTNHTHWYGVTIGMRHSGYRDDTRTSTKPPPDGTKLVFQLKPLGKAIDGHDVQPSTVERTYDSKSLSNYDLNDLPCTAYEVSGVAKFPDGSTRPLLLQGKGDYPNFKSTVIAKPEKDSVMGNGWMPTVAFVVE